MQNLIFKSRNLQKLVIILSAFAFIIIGCGGGGDGGGSPSAASPTVETGTFLDSPVQGLSYETATQSDVTDANGTFKYQTGETIKFFLGDILIGQATAKKTMTPIDLVPGATNEMHQTVTNICRLLQSLDYDSNPDNGIYITQQIRNEIEGRTIDFNMSTAEFGADADVIALFNTLNAMNAFSIRADRTLCTAQQAQNHLRETLGINDGSSDSSGHDESNYSEQWYYGNTDESGEVHFYVSDTQVKAFEIYTYLTGGFCGHGWLWSAIDPALTISGNNFSFSNDYFDVNGTFTSSTTCTGTWDIHNPCTGYSNGTWTATIAPSSSVAP